MQRLRLLHVVHDFLPRHAAGAEIYAYELCRELSRRGHHVSILCAEYDPSREHGDVTWRVYGGLPVIEIVNNWECASFIETYRPSSLENQLSHILQATQPDVVHVHNLLNLSFDLPAMAKARSARVVATLHDYTLVCASGGQRIHRSEEYVCRTIDPERCARCFRESPFFEQASFARVTGRAPSSLRHAAASMARRFPTIARRAAAVVPPVVRGPAVASADIQARLDAARGVFDDIDLFVAPSSSLAAEFLALGMDATKLCVSDNGFAPLRSNGRTPNRGRLRIGYVGTIVWHKGVHVLIDAVRRLPAATYELKVFGDPAVSPMYSAGLRAAAVDGPVTFMGPFDGNARTDVYEQIDVLVVPSLWLENSPLVIHEAFMAGVPVVGSRIGGTAELISDGVNGLLYEPTSPVELAAVLQELITDRERLEQFRTHLPVVKTLDEDAMGWEQRYGMVMARAGMSVET